MSLIGGKSGGNRKLHKIFSTRSSSSSRNVDGTVSIPGYGQEVSRTMSNENHLKIFCEQVSNTVYFKTTDITATMTVLECIKIVAVQIAGNENEDPNKYDLYEVIGKLIPDHKTAANKQTIFSEIKAHLLHQDEKMMDIISIMAPTPGFARRIELRPRKQFRPALHSQDTLTTWLADGSSPSPRTHQVPLLAPTHPYLLLVKGSRPEKDLLVQNLSALFTGSKRCLSIGASNSDDIRLYSESSLSKSLTSIEGLSPMVLTVKHHTESNVKDVWIEINSNFNAIDQGSPLNIRINWDSFNDAKKQPTERCLNPGDVLQIEAYKLNYVFLFKDSSLVPEHELSLNFLLLPQMNRSGPPSSVVNRSASRTARISASKELARPPNNFPVQRPSRLKDEEQILEKSVPAISDVTYVVEMLFPDPVYTPDVAVSAGCFAHLVRSVAIKGLASFGVNYVRRASEDELLQSVIGALSKALDSLSPTSPNHMKLAIWKAAFCFYLTNYLSPGWLCNPPAKRPRIFASDRRQISAASTPDSDGFQRTPNIRRRTSNSPSVSVNEEVELLPILVTLRKSASAEADFVMENAIDFALETTSKHIVKLCHLFARSSKSDRVKDKQVALFDELDRIQSCLNQVFNGTPSESTSSVGDTNVVKLAHAEEYHQEGDRESGNGSMGKHLASSSDADEISSEEGFRRTSPSSHSSGTEKTDINNAKASRAQYKIEEVFFRRLLAGLSRKIIEEFLNAPTLIINWETGVQLLNLVKALDNWMKCAGILNYLDTLILVYDFSSLMAAPKNDLFSINWSEIRQQFPNIPPSILSFLLESYENGQGKRRMGSDWESDETVDDKSVHKYLLDFTSYWERKERLSICTEGGAGPDRSAHNSRPVDLASLFQSSRMKNAIQKYDQQLVTEKSTFQWVNLLRMFPPPGLTQKKASPDEVFNANNLNELDEEAAFGLPNELKETRMLTFRDFGDLHREVRLGIKRNLPEIGTISRRQNQFLEPISSPYGPARSMLNENIYAQHHTGTYAASEMGGSLRSATVNRLIPVAGGGFRSRPGIYEIGKSTPQLHFDPPAQNRFARNPNTSETNHVFPRSFNPSLNVAKSMDFNEIKRTGDILQDWTNFKRIASRPSSPSHDSTLNGDSHYLGGGSTLTLNNSHVMAQSEYPVRSVARSLITTPIGQGEINRQHSLLNLTTREYSGSCSSMLGVDRERSPNMENTIDNVTLNRVATESYGVVPVDGYTTRLEQMGVYIKALTSGSPAEQSHKLAVGDRILAINGIELTTMTFKEACNLLRESGTSATFTIQRGCVECPEYLLDPREK